MIIIIIDNVKRRRNGVEIDMMINKRLISICDESKKYMGLTILCSWIGKNTRYRIF